MNNPDIYLKQLNYYVIPGRLDFNFSYLDLHNSCYSFWKRFWVDVFTKNGCPSSFDADVFLRQNMICVLKSKDEIVGLHLYSLYNLDSLACIDHSYINNSFNSTFIEEIKNRKIKKTMSLEYLTVNENWRKSKIGTSIARILISLSNEILKSIKYDASIAPSRSDVGVTKMCLELGAENIVPNINMHNTPCDLIAFNRKNIKHSKDNLVRDWTKRFWDNRNDYTNITNLITNDNPIQNPALRVAV